MKDSSPHFYSLLSKNFSSEECQQVVEAYEASILNNASEELDGVITLKTANPRPARIGVIMLKEQLCNSLEELILAIELAGKGNSEIASPSNDQTKTRAELALWLDRIRHAHLIPKESRVRIVKDLLEVHSDYISNAKKISSPLLDKLLLWETRAKKIIDS